ncbi:putative Tropinone reductase [Trichoderma sp. SZMC 28012]
MPGRSTKLGGSHILVTGGTKGIGRAIVEAFLAEGANVSYCARSVIGNEFASVTADAKNGGVRAVGTAVDIGEAAAIRSWVEASAAEFGRIDAIIANAASFCTDATLESWQRSFDMDMLGLISLVEAAVPHLQKNTAISSIVVISSLAGFEARHHSVTGPYATLKRAQATLAKEYARKLGPIGVRVNTIVPGTIETPGQLLPDGTREPSRFEMARRNNPEYINGLLDSIPLGRAGAVEDVANAVVFLTSPLAAYISGAALFVDGALAIGF